MKPFTPSILPLLMWKEERETIPSILFKMVFVNFVNWLMPTSEYTFDHSSSLLLMRSEPLMERMSESSSLAFTAFCSFSLEASIIMDIGSYWYDDRRTHEHGEFDIVLEYADGYDVFEAKFLRAAMPRSLADEEAAKILAIPQFKARRIGFVSMEGFGFSPDEYVLIDGGMLYGD